MNLGEILYTERSFQRPKTLSVKAIYSIHKPLEHDPGDFHTESPTMYSHPEEVL